MDYRISRYLEDEEHLEENNITKFDYLLDELPDDLLYRMGDQLERTRKILKSRTRMEIEYGIESLSWMLQEGSKLLFNDSIEALKTKDMYFTNRVKALRLLQTNIDLSNQENFPNATWADYFALLSLISIVESYYYINQNLEADDTRIGKLITEGRKISVNNLIIDYAIESMDAISHAEGLLSSYQIESQASSIAAKEMGKKGLKIKAQRFNDIKQKVLALYLDRYNRRSNRDAAKRIYTDLQNEIDYVSSSDEPEKLIEKWIGQYKRGKLNIEVNM